MKNYCILFGIAILFIGLFVVSLPVKAVLYENIQFWDTNGTGFYYPTGFTSQVHYSYIDGDGNLHGYCGNDTYDYNNNAWARDGYNVNLDQPHYITISATRPVGGFLSYAQPGDFLRIYVDGNILAHLQVDGYGNVGVFNGVLGAGNHKIAIDGTYLYGTGCENVRFIIAATVGEVTNYTCGDVPYDPATQACCGESYSSYARVYNTLEGQSCCRNQDGSFVQIYSEGKNEQCCYSGTNFSNSTVANVCNGCERCVTTDKNYRNIRAPTSGWSSMYYWEDRRCVGWITENRGQCVNKCEGCSNCVGDTATGRKKCVDTAQQLTEQHYKEHPKDQYKYPEDPFASVYVCACGKGFPSGDQGHSVGSCFAYSDSSNSATRDTQGYPPGTGYEGDNGCPMNSPYDPYKLKSGCHCAGPGYCSTGYVCSDTPCVYPSHDDGLHRVFRWNCGISYCCSVPAPTATGHCRGLNNMFCLPGGTGKACQSNSDCQKPPNNGGGDGDGGADGADGTGNLASGCDANRKCVPGGAGAACGGDADCANPAFECNADRRCVPGGGGGACNIANKDADCAPVVYPYQCNAKRQCVPGGGGGACNIANGNADCALPAFECNKDRQCVPGGGGKGCTVATQAADCGVVPFQCNLGRQCVPGGGGNACTVVNQLADCGIPPTCNAQKKCVENGGGGACPSINAAGDAFCQVQQTRCTDDLLQCLPGANGRLCDVPADCQNNPPVAVPYIDVSECAYAYTHIPASGLANFKWHYSDDEGDAQTMYRLQIGTSPNFDDSSNIVYDTGITAGAGTQVYVPVLLEATNPTSSCVNLSQKCSFINYGVPYYWRVMVWEAVTGLDSGWARYVDSHTFVPVPDNYCPDDASGYFHGCADDNDRDPNTFTYPYAHPLPAVSYTPPISIAPNRSATFIDGSYCYRADGTAYLCKTLVPSSEDPVADVCSAAPDANCYTWTFGDGTGNNYKIGNPSHIYVRPDTYRTSLTVCDDLGCCSAALNVGVGSSNANTVPQWWEISPY